MPTLHVINGRFGAQRVTGVQRVAHGLLGALDACTELPGHWQLLSPSGAQWPPLSRIELVTRPVPAGGGHGWEQTIVAAAAARGARVLNIAGSGPWLGGSQVSWLHDAAVFDHPEAYRPAFVHWYRALFRHRARRGDLLITPSEHARGRLALHLGLAESRIAVLPHGADHLDAVEPDGQLLHRHRLSPDRYWLAVASANPNKNLARLADAWARVPGPLRLPLVLVGGHHPQVFADAAASAPAALTVLGAVDDPALKALLLGARALVIPSIVEGFGLPALEALRCACPVIAARAAALPEVCGDAAHYVDPLDVEDMAAALSRLARDDEALLRLRAAGPARARAFTWAGAVQRLLRLLAVPPAELDRVGELA